MVHSLDLGGDGRPGDSTGMAATCDMAAERMRSTAGRSIAAMRTFTAVIAAGQGLTMALRADMPRDTERPEREVSRERGAVLVLVVLWANAERRERIAVEHRQRTAMRERARER